ncbi:SafA/ExsA family spore coat assembly protein [Virgibacillus sp. YIM 98842]|uniref:LysM peptidoglycan-binding domain-containing protein n=1 Tax=Virgibacillus sp. YIM 98842 TaxID=2663533 RepID=UPI0013D99EE8|nr:SafA/ExsA family spore coat assembly protein [Virgibacillus sp. YIM 98842]
MKIHVVQKGDTLWEISQKYGVDFEEVKQLNSHLSSPDMIMPGMKIKVPSSTKAVKHDGKTAKESKKEQVKQPYKDVSPKPMPVIKEDDKKPPKKVQPELPKMPQMPLQPIIQMPILEQDYDYHTTIKFPEMPKQPEMKKEKPKMQPKPLPTPKPIKEEKKEMMPASQPMPVPMAPCCYMVHPCFPAAPYPMMAPAFNHHHHAALPTEQHGKNDCGCQGTPMPYQNMMPYPMYQDVNNENMPQSGFMSPHQQQHTDYTTEPQQQPNFGPSPQQQSNLYPPPFSTDMNQAYPNPPGYPQNYYRKDKEQTEHEE